MELEIRRQGESGSSPNSALEILCDLGSVSCPLWASVSSSIQEELRSVVSKNIPYVGGLALT